MSKVEKMGQLPLQLPVEVANARDDLVVTVSNASAVRFLDSWPDWPAPIVILAGPVGAGKTHLARIWAAQASAAFLVPSAGTSDQLPDAGNYVVEDIAQGSFSEAWLFHLINTALANANTLLLTSRRWPGDWGIALPDLQSRMKLAHLVELNEPDDALLGGVLTKLFSDRQLQVDSGVIDYLVMRMERSLASAQSLVQTIDALSLAQKRPVTKPLASKALLEQGISQ